MIRALLLVTLKQGREAFTFCPVHRGGITGESEDRCMHFWCVAPFAFGLLGLLLTPPPPPPSVSLSRALSLSLALTSNACSGQQRHQLRALGQQMRQRDPGRPRRPKGRRRVQSLQRKFLVRLKEVHAVRGRLLFERRQHGIVHTVGRHVPEWQHRCARQAYAGRPLWFMR